MWPFRRRSHETSKEAALADARRAIARLRRESEEIERYRAGKQAAPADRMTPHQWIAGGG
jgi:hypothetical protein